MLRSVGGVRLSVEELGEASDPAVLMLHGHPVDHRILREPMEAVFAGRPGWRRIYADMPGYGASPPNGAIDGSDAVLEVVLALARDAGGGDPVLIIGQSWGGYLAHAAALRHPELVAGVAMLCPLVVPEHARRDVPAHEAAVVEPGVGEGADAADLEEFRGIAVVQDAAHWAFFRSAIMPALRAADPETVARVDARYGIESPADARYDGPVLIVTGRQDAIVGHRDAERLAGTLPHATFVVLDGAGHHAHVERPAAVASLLGDWLDQVRR